MHPDSDKLLMVTPVCSHGLLYGSVHNPKATGLPVQNLLPWRPLSPVRRCIFYFLLPAASEWNPTPGSIGEPENSPHAWKNPGGNNSADLSESL